MNIRKHRLPYLGERYDLDVGRGTTLAVVVQRDGSRAISVLSGGSDEPVVSVPLTHEQSVAVAALLTGARFSIVSNETDVEGEVEGDVDVQTVEVGPSSPAAGRLVRDIPLPAGCDAAILAVIRDSTPELVEDDDREPARVGDRLVVAARRDRIGEVVRFLAG